MSHDQTSLAPPRVRLAYTLNHDQPVRCTLISEEPLFYLDAPSTEEDELLAEFAELGLPADLLLDTPAEEPPLLPMLREASAEAIDLFKQQFGQGSAPLSLPLDQVITRLGQSRMGAALIAAARSAQVKITEGSQMPAIQYDRMGRVITLRTGLPEPLQILLLARELRRVGQQAQGALLHPLLFHPDQAMIINRVQAADLTVMMVRVAWEMKLAGDDLPWTYLAQNGFDDLTRSFAREALHDFRALNNGRAGAAAFEAWFLSERCRVFDRLLIQQMLADYQSYVHQAGAEETSKVLSHQIIAALGQMPYGQNYLSPYTATILADPIFTEVRDRSNANFLWFIKFEQSFRATERDLRGGDGVTLSVPGTAGHTASIHTLPAPRRLVPSGTTADPSSPSATIVDLTSWKRR